MKKKEKPSTQARQFIHLLKTGVLSKEILPNSSPNYTDKQERIDTRYYVDFFLRSSIYDSIEESEVVTYHGE